MARDRASIRLDIWTDDDFRDLSLAAQHLYLHLLSSPTLSYAGVADWRPARIAGISKDATAQSVGLAADELVAGLFIVIDDDTEEVLIRSFLKHDGLMHKPNVAKAMVASYGKTVSRTLRGVMVHELIRMNERDPELRAFQEPTVSDLLNKPAINPSNLISKGFQKDEGKGSEFDPSLLASNSLLLATDFTQLATSPNDVRDDVLGLCSLLASLIEENGSKRPNVTDAWMNAARLLLDKDKRDFTAAQRLIEWCQRDSFWMTNILSMPKFRDKYDQLRLDANRQLEERKTKPTRSQENLSYVSSLFENQQMEIES